MTGIQIAHNAIQRDFAKPCAVLLPPPGLRAGRTAPMKARRVRVRCAPCSRKRPGVA